MSFTILRGQSVRWRLTMKNDGVPVNMAGGTWGVQETQFKPENEPTFENNGLEAWVIWSPEQTARMGTGRKKLRLKFCQPGGAVKVLPDRFVTVV